MSLTLGGVWLFVMHGPDGTDYENKIVYHEVVKPERLVYEHCGVVEFQVTVTFEDVDGKTRVTMQSLFSSAEELQRVDKQYGAIKGAGEHITRLGEYLSEVTEQ